MARFWDTSAVIPLLVQEPLTDQLLALLRQDAHVIVWWGTQVEAVSALARRVREGILAGAGYTQARSVLAAVADSWSEVLPSPRVRSVAERLLLVHPLSAADALQLAAAVRWSDDAPHGRVFVCLDDRLGEAAQREGFTVQSPGGV